MQKTKSMAILGIVALIMVIVLHSISNPYTMEDVTQLEEDRYYYTEKSPILIKIENQSSIKDIKTDEKIYFQYTLSEREDDDYILVGANHQNMTVRLGDTEIFSKIFPIGENPGVTWNFIPIDRDEYSDKLTVLVSSPYKEYSGRVPEVFFGDPISLYSYILSDSIFDIVIFMLCVVTAILGVITYLLWNKAQKRTMTLSLSVFLILLGLYLISSRPILSLLFSPIVVSKIHMILIFIIPTMLIYIMAKCFTRYKFVVMINFLVCAVFDVIVIFSAQFNLMHLPALIPSLLILVVISIFVIFAASTAEILIGNKRPYALGAMILIFGFAILYRRSDSMVSKYALMSCAIIACIYYISQLTGNIMSIKRLKVSNKKLQDIAFLDAFTGLRNRNAFEQFMLIMEEEDLEKQKVSVIVFDLNNLKRVNDTLGHKAGDDYIIKCTTNISKYFSDDEEEIFRIGGDEFVVICAGLTIKNIRERLAEMDRELISISTGLDYCVGVAHGVALFDKKRDKTLNDTMRRADKEMYSNKLDMKRSLV